MSRGERTQLSRLLFNSARVGEATWKRAERVLLKYGYIAENFDLEDLERGLALAGELVFPGLDPDSELLLVGLAHYSRSPRCGFKDADAGHVRAHKRLELVTKIPFNLKYWITPNPPYKVSAPAMRANIMKALSRWSDVRIGDVRIFDFSEEVVMGDAHIKFLWEAIDDLDGEVANAMPAGLGERQGIIRFDSLDSWTAIENLDDFHIQTIALHEIGHSLGLAHIFQPPIPEPTMEPNFNPQEDITLEDVDMQALRDLYQM